MRSRRCCATCAELSIVRAAGYSDATEARCDEGAAARVAALACAEGEPRAASAMLPKRGMDGDDATCACCTSCCFCCCLLRPRAAAPRSVPYEAEGDMPRGRAPTEAEGASKGCEGTPTPACRFA